MKTWQIESWCNLALMIILLIKPYCWWKMMRNKSVYQQLFKNKDSFHVIISFMICNLWYIFKWNVYKKCLVLKVWSIMELSWPLIRNMSICDIFFKICVLKLYFCWLNYAAPIVKWMNELMITFKEHCVIETNICVKINP